MLAKNTTPFAALAFEQIHRDGQPMAVIVARATYTLSADGRLELADTQQLVLADEYEGDPHETPMIRVGDLIPFKPRADICVQGNAYPAGGTDSTFWHFGIRVGRLAHVLRANGWRNWEPADHDAGSPQTGAQGKWRLGAAEAIGHAPLNYRYSAGGKIIGHPDGERNPFNPIGKGVLHPSFTPQTTRIPAPVIDSEDAPATDDPFAGIEPQGMGPVPPFWRFRQQYAGTYDEAWKQHRHPQLPDDFDYRFYQTAHPKLICPGYLTGNEEVELVGLVPGGGRVSFNLPAVQPYARFAWIDDREATARLNLDGLHIDLREGPPWRVDLTWRAWAVICPRFFKVDLFHTALSDPSLKGLVGSNEDGLFEDEAAVALDGVVT